MTVGTKSSADRAGRGAAAEVLVVGAGVIGMAIARELADRGAGVTVVDRGIPGMETSRVAAGMLAPVAEAAYGEERLLELTLESARMYPDFVAELERETGVETGFRRCGALHIALDRDEAAELRRRIEFLRGLGLDPDWLTPSACRSVEPELATSFHGGMRVPEESAIDPRLLCRALESSLTGPPGARSGRVELRVGPGMEVVEAIGDRSRLDGVVLRSGERIAAPEIVVATGALPASHSWLPEGTAPPVRPVKGQILELCPRRLGPEHAAGEREPVISGIVATERIYLVPHTGGRLIAGATVEEQGYDTAVTAGGVHELLREAYRAVPEIAELELVEATAGLRPGTPDNLPLVTRAETEGLVHATGHYRNGILLAPLTARDVANLLERTAAA